ncbi:metallophosphoesterase family protein [Chryseobacterium daecheongense]|uniref:Calcineurin-like phosphoesterase family protein n=1 Tax=Chryseobacterium daecheongense TaxID=192389 RepID=A0A3N0VTJ7_9FLAO|nr:metallophosphoesterase [Chryseobacterium daecheongense]ROH96143.1 metallophosphoesterase [Chryseobacterium daecheongense]TDX91442.1 calcineurin-like phosphoesterase family protein [Chryseobacterium daecheongense]
MNKGIFSFLLFGFSLCWAQQKPVQIAFLSDVHFQDLYGRFSDHDFKGIINPKTGKPTILRTMDSQLHSTRIFNENYFAFLKALDDIAAKGIKIVAMPGDFSDDGQAYNIRGLHKILEKYHKRYGINFYITTGNHDPVGPFRQNAGKDDFLGQDGSPLGIYSKENIGKIKNKIITKDIAESGYLEILDELRDFGFYPKKENLFWSTPFNFQAVKNYSYEKVLQNADYSKRIYEVSKGFSVPDLSYIVEPVKGIWMIAIDGNTYIPKNVNEKPDNPSNYKGASIGYNNVLTNKRHLIDWMKKITEEAKLNGKTVIAFTHYPMIDFNDGATKEIENVLGEKKWQLERVPEEDVAKAFAEAGLQIHFAGHMHINDTGIRKIGNKILVNVQVPSLAAYLPAYKILTIHSSGKMEVQTEVLNDVPNFDELFPLYEKEYDALRKNGNKTLWNKDILHSETYHDFMLFHLKELVRLRMIPEDWPRDFIEKVEKLNGEDLLLLVQNKDQIKESEIDSKAFQKWFFGDALLDLYKFQSADELAKKDIPKERLQQYYILEKLFQKSKSQDPFVLQLKSVFKILSLLSNGDPADHFEIDLKKQKIKRL